MTNANGPVHLKLDDDDSSLCGVAGWWYLLGEFSGLRELVAGDYAYWGCPKCMKDPRVALFLLSHTDL